MEVDEHDETWGPILRDSLDYQPSYSVILLSEMENNIYSVTTDHAFYRDIHLEEIQRVPLNPSINLCQKNLIHEVECEIDPPNQTHTLFDPLRSCPSNNFPSPCEIEDNLYLVPEIVASKTLPKEIVGGAPSPSTNVREKNLVQQMEYEVNPPNGDDGTMVVDCPPGWRKAARPRHPRCRPCWVEKNFTQQMECEVNPPNRDDGTMLVDCLPGWRKAARQRHPRRRRCWVAPNFTQKNPQYFENMPSKSGGRKNNKHWTQEEVRKLVEGISRYQVGQWKNIKAEYFPQSVRDAAHLKDKWKNLLKSYGVKDTDEQKRNKQKKMLLTLNPALVERIKAIDKSRQSKFQRRSSRRSKC